MCTISYIYIFKYIHQYTYVNTPAMSAPYRSSPCVNQGQDSSNGVGVEVAQKWDAPGPVGRAIP